ncbi:hypothetical protein HELRODRAFT_184232 [Helobdella robusta]|uniref:Uncharacterized protein n=1 Tax=Helobdella robusta TaxID=6412 RepID=T1FKT3_HELRO|nr:hypothetical protein HELRODRAFT_184232 [Helobdella robusta]ESO04504.1 hypothetical protein HELRODRAFT_184232 [Helobdella robusta]
MAQKISRPLAENVENVDDCCVNFELLAYDMLLDEHSKLWLLSIHQSPSLDVHCEVEADVKQELIGSLLRLVQKLILKTPNSKRKVNSQLIDDQISCITNALMLKNKIKPLITKHQKQMLNELMAGLSTDIEQVTSKYFKLIFPCNNPQLMDSYTRFLKKIYSIFESFFSENDYKKYLEKQKLILLQIQENWDEMKEEVAKFWFSQLNVAKQKQVIDVVNNKVEFILISKCHLLNCHNVTFLRTCKRIFNHLLSNHGSALWESFSQKRLENIDFAMSQFAVIKFTILCNNKQSKFENNVKTKAKFIKTYFCSTGYLKSFCHWQTISKKTRISVDVDKAQNPCVKTFQSFVIKKIFQVFQKMWENILRNESSPLELECYRRDCNFENDPSGNSKPVKHWNENRRARRFCFE